MLHTHCISRPVDTHQTWRYVELSTGYPGPVDTLPGYPTEQMIFPYDTTAKTRRYVYEYFHMLSRVPPVTLQSPTSEPLSRI